MKRMFLIFGVMAASFGCFGQRYEVWLQTEGIQSLKVMNLEHSNDSILSVYSNPTIFTPVRNANFRWNNVYTLKIRNKTKHGISVGLGFAIGSLPMLLLLKSDKFIQRYDWGAPIMAMTYALAGGGAGALIGHLVTPKIIIPLNGKSAREKNQALQEFMNKTK
jgi:hypothetical protein